MSESIIGTFFNKEEGKAYEVNEGNVTVSTGYSCLNGVEQKFFTFARPVREENFLEFDLGSGKDLQIKPATIEATHITMYEPEFPAGALPTADVIDGSYKRYVTAFKLKPGELALPVNSLNSEITSGDYLVINSYNSGVTKYDGSDSDQKTVVALESKSANTGGYILAELTEGSIPFNE